MLLPNRDEFACTLAEDVPFGGEGLGVIGGFHFEGFGAALGIDLDELHEGFEPVLGAAGERGSDESDNDLSAGAMDFEAADLDDLADVDGFDAAEVEDAFEHEIGHFAGGAVSGGVSGLESEGEQLAGVEGAVVVGVAWQDQAVSQDLNER